MQVDAGERNMVCLELSLPTVWMACRRECLCFGGDRDEGEAHDVFAVFGVAAIQLRSALAGPALEKDPRNAELVKYFEGQGYKPEGYTLYTYGAIQAWAQAVAKAGTTDSEAVIEALHSGASFDTVLGSISFDAKGDVAAPGYVFYEWENGSYDYAN